MAHDMSTTNLLTRPAKDYIEVHSIDTDTRVILDAKIDVFLNAKTKVSSTTEVVPAQLVLTHLKQMKLLCRM